MLVFFGGDSGQKACSKIKNPPGVSEEGFGGLDLELEWGKLEEEWEELAGVGGVVVESELGVVKVGV